MNDFWINKKVVVTGGNGFLGKVLTRKIIKLNGKVSAPTSKELDLRLKENCKIAVKGADIVIHLAAKVGGIGFNRMYPGEMFYDNILMGVFMLDEARKEKVKKFVLLGTICAYPKFTPIPFKEDNLWNGYPEETNAPYGLAKKALLVQSQSYRDQYGFNSIYLLPVNLYGIGDNFNPQSSHVIPALIKKIFQAKRLKRKSVTVWGSGNATREFLYVDDAADAILLATEKYNNREPVNIGAGYEISIRELVKKISEKLDYKGKIIFDLKKPDGQPRRCLDTSRAYKEFGFKAKTSLDEGLDNTIKWYLSRETHENN